MANKTITFSKEINTSLQPTDIIYILRDGESHKVKLGTCVSVASDRKSFVVDVLNSAGAVDENTYFMFNKNNVINSNGLIGYHATVTMKNTSTEFCELYAVNSEVSISS